MGELRTEVVRVTTTGSDGSAAGSAVSGVINGLIENIYLDFHASAPAGTHDTTISYTIRGGNILAVANSVTDALFTPRAKPVDLANAAITNAHTRFACNQTLTVTVAQSNALTDDVVAHITYRTV